MEEIKESTFKNNLFLVAVLLVVLFVSMVFLQKRFEIDSSYINTISIVMVFVIGFIIGKGK